jgi:hypothetical protein
MELYDGGHFKAQKVLQQTINYGDTAYEANRKLKWDTPDIGVSVTSQYNSCDSKIVIQKTNFKHPTVDTMQYEYVNTLKPDNNRNLSLLNEIEESRTSIRPHNTFPSDRLMVD